LQAFLLDTDIFTTKANQEHRSKLSLSTAMTLPGNTDKEKLDALCEKTYKEQIIWFLNAYWHKHEDQAERMWDFCHKCAELDLEQHEEGSALDEVSAHRFLELFKETMTVREMRAKLRESGALGEGRVPRVPITHILIFRYNIDWKYLVNASQGDNKEDIEKAQRMLEQVQQAYQRADERANEAAQAVTEAESREAASQRAEVEAKEREDEARAAKAELESALSELHAQEDAYNSKTALLEKKSEEGGVVSRNKAKAELAQHLGEDPLPLRKAKITQQAAVKKAERTAQAAADSRAAAAEATKRATEAKNESIKAKEAAEAAVAEAAEKVKEAEDYLQEVKSRPGQAQGALWWIERELHEAKAYKPERLGGYRKQ